MLFSEIYSAYYNAMAYLISCAIDGTLNGRNIYEIINNTAFSESSLFITDAIKSEQWKLITKDYKTPIRNNPQMPLTELQLRFLKAITLDKRFALFADVPEGLENIEPLYFDDDFYIFDIIKDGDPYEDEAYRQIFRTVLKALNEKRKISVSFKSGKGYPRRGIYIPGKLEYSGKDDKFRLICKGRRGTTIINMARIESCRLLDKYDEEKITPIYRRKCALTLEITDRRDALERAMTNFANYEKETSRIGENTYLMKIKYKKEDETEVLIRVLSFGPMMKVTSPQHFIELIKQRLNNQRKLQT